MKPPTPSPPLPSPAMASDPAAMKTEVVGGGGGADAEDPIFKGLKKARRDRGCTAKDRISKMPPCAAGKRSSIYRGVTRHRWTGRYEAHLWDKSTWNQNQNKKGKQVYLGAYDDEEAAARAYDLAALKYWGPGTIINFPVSDYSRDLEEMQMMSREDYLASLRRKSSGFSRGLSKYRGIPRSTQNRWDSSFGQMLGNEYFSNLNCGTSEEAATENELLAGFCLERKIDLTGYIKWWGTTHKTHRSESHSKSSEGSHKVIENIGTELKSSEWSVQHTEPYQFPSLGLPHSKKTVPLEKSAYSIVSQSTALKCLQDKLTKVQEGNNKEKLAEDGAGKPEAPTTSGELCLARTSYPYGPFISSSLLTSCSAIDNPIPDPLFWTGLVPSTGLSSSTVVSIGRKSTENIYPPQ